jgi:putative transposase
LDELEREGKARRERAQTVALWRYTLVAPAMDEALTSRERGHLVRVLAEREHPGPFGTRMRVSRKTLDRWIRTRRRGGFEALLPTPRRVEPRTDAAVLALAVSLKKENPRRTAAQVRRILVELSPQRWAPAERTLQRHFAALGLNVRPDGRPPKVLGRFEADRINEIWTADTLHGPKIAGRKAYVHGIIDDIFSRYVVGWRAEEAEDNELATQLIDQAISTYGKPETVHADRGTSMTSKSVAKLLVDLDVFKSHSRPHVSNDNPYSEAQFKTLKYCPAFPGHFDGIEHVRAFCKEFFDYYNHEHYSALGLNTPASVHFGEVLEIRTKRATVLQAAYARNPERFGRPPEPPKLPEVAWINPPDQAAPLQAA